MLVLSVPQRRARLAFGLESYAPLAWLVPTAFTAQLLCMTPITCPAYWALGHDHSSSRAPRQVRDSKGMKQAAGSDVDS